MRCSFVKGFGKTLWQGGTTGFLCCFPLFYRGLNGATLAILGWHVTHMRAASGDTPPLWFNPREGECAALALALALALAPGAGGVG